MCSEIVTAPALARCPGPKQLLNGHCTIGSRTFMTSWGWIVEKRQERGLQSHLVYLVCSMPLKVHLYWLTNVKWLSYASMEMPIHLPNKGWINKMVILAGTPCPVFAGRVLHTLWHTKTRVRVFRDTCGGRCLLHCRRRAFQLFIRG
jgi:hypothetical protein